jgi:hypothetical protein
MTRTPLKIVRLVAVTPQYCFREIPRDNQSHDIRIVNEFRKQFSEFDEPVSGSFWIRPAVRPHPIGILTPALEVYSAPRPGAFQHSAHVVGRYPSPSPIDSD